MQFFAIFAAELAGGKHGERRCVANFPCAKAQKNGGKYEERHRVGTSAAEMKGRSAAVARLTNLALVWREWARFSPI